MKTASQLAILVLATLNLSAATMYVSLESTNPLPPYATWATAATNIQDAIDVAANGDTVLVTNGIYASGGRAVFGTMTNRVAVDRPVVLRSVNGAAVTVIQGYQVPGSRTGDGAIRCVYLTNGAVLSGFTLTNGATRDSAGQFQELSGGGVWCESTNALVTNCTITGNRSASNGGGAYGGTLNNCTLTNNWVRFYNYSIPLIFSSGGGASFCTLNNCTLTDNYAEWDGGGAADSTLNNCTLTGNLGDYGDGGGALDSTLNNCTLTENFVMYENGGGAADSMLNNCTLTGNYADDYGGGASDSTLNNCTLTSNLAGVGGGGAYGGTLNNCSLTENWAYAFGGGAREGTLNNCTITGNSANYRGGGVDWGTTLNNCIVYYNTAGNTGSNYYESTLNYCCTTPDPGSGVGNITAEPLFVDLLNGNLRLQSTSPCINVGTNQDWMIGATDLDGNPRIISGVVDLGAFEFLNTSPVITTQPLDETVTEGGTIVFSVMAEGTGPLSYQWWFSNAPIAGAIAPSLFITNATTNLAGIYFVVVTNVYGSITSSNAALTVLPAQAKIRVIAASGVSGGNVVVPIHMTVSTNENALGFSLVYDPAVLSYDSIALGSGSAGGSWLPNMSQTNIGKLGIAVSMPIGVSYAPGTQEVVKVTFLARPVTAPTMTLVNFGDQPTPRELVNVQAAVLPATYSGAAVQVAPGTYEADVAPRPNGDHNVSIADWVQVGRFVAWLDEVTGEDEFLRADCAPRSSRGNGNLTVTDWVQAGRYAAGLDPITIVGGPTAGYLQSARGPVPSGDDPLRVLRVSVTNSWGGQTVTACLQMVSLGDETALGTTLSFDSTALRFLSARLGAHTQNATLNVNTNDAEAGRLGLVLSLPFGNTLASGTRELVVIDLQIAPTSSGTIPLTLTDVPVVREVSDTAANILLSSYENGAVGVTKLPVLNAALLSRAIKLSWAVPTAPFVVQSSETLASWIDVIEQPTTNGSTVSVTVPLSGTNQFFRLRRN